MECKYTGSATAPLWRGGSVESPVCKCVGADSEIGKSDTITESAEAETYDKAQSSARSCSKKEAGLSMTRSAAFNRGALLEV
jgi:hypothetical protein